MRFKHFERSAFLIVKIIKNIQKNFKKLAFLAFCDIINELMF